MMTCTVPIHQREDEPIWSWRLDPVEAPDIDTPACEGGEESVEKTRIGTAYMLWERQLPEETGTPGGGHLSSRQIRSLV